MVLNIPGGMIGAKLSGGSQGRDMGGPLESLGSVLKRQPFNIRFECFIDTQIFFNSYIINL